MTELNEIEIYVKVAEAKSFTLAANHLGISKASVSKSITRLEKSLGTRLIQRTTRRLILTDAGVKYYQHSVRALAEMDLAKKAIHSLKAAPSGRLRVTAPVTFGNLHVASHIPTFLQTFENVNVDLVLTDRKVNLTAEGFDLAIRLSAQPGLNLIAKKIAPTKRVLCASPLYLDRFGKPKLLQDLSHHQCLSYLHFTAKPQWCFKGPKGIIQVAVNGRYQINNIEAIQSAVLDGCGIALMPTYLVGPEIASGRLIEILPQHESVSEFGDHVLAAYPPDRFLLPKVRVFIEFLKKKYGPRPYWDKQG